MRFKYNSFTNQITIESKLTIDEIALKVLKDFFTSQGIDASLPVVEYDTKIMQLLIKIDDTRFKIWNDELQLNLVLDVLELISKFGFELLEAYKPDTDVYLNGKLIIPEYDSISNWLTRTESYPNCITYPYEKNRVNEYFLKTIGYWSELELHEYLKTIPKVISSQAIIRGTEFKKAIMIIEKNTQSQSAFLAMQEFVKTKEVIRFDEFGDYRFYLP